MERLLPDVRAGLPGADALLRLLSLRHAVQWAAARDKDLQQHGHLPRYRGARGGFQGRDGGGGHVGTRACVGVSRWRGKWGCLGARREGGFVQWGQQEEPSSSPPILSPPLLWQPSGVCGGRHLQDVPPCPVCLALLLFILIPRGCREPRGFPGEVWSWGRGRGWACAVGLGPGGLVRGRRWPSCSSTVLSRGASRMDACGGTSSALPVCLSAHSGVRVSCVGLRGPVGPRGAAGLPRPGGAGGLCTP